MKSIIIISVSVLIMVAARFTPLNTRLDSYDPFLILVILGGVLFVIVDEIVKEDERLKSLSPGLLEFAAQLVATFTVVYVLLGYVIYPAQVNGVSMSPTFASGDSVLIYLPSTPQHGDIAILHITPQTTSHFTEEYMIKRIMGVAGDLITTDGTTIYRNGEALLEPYVTSQSAYRFPCFQPGNCSVIPEGYVFVLGDNRSQSVDSRSYGLVPITHVEGRVIFNFSEISLW
jgi:signal peptidase I